MAKIAFILLAHKDPEGIIAQARRLTATGDFVALHYDARAPQADYDRIRAALADDPHVTFSPRRHKCGWGMWSLVGATLDTVRAALAAFPAASHLYMLSGDCMPIKSATYARAMLDREDADFIESFDFFTSGWIKTGFIGERLHYRHWFNEREQKRLFYWSYNAQRALGLARKVPAGIRVMIGSQWWCLRRDTVEKVLDFMASRRDVLRFFRTTWIPDETFFQTLVNHLVPRDQIRRRTLTFKMFTDYGMPVTFHNDHLDMLLGQDALFARKISPHAMELKAALGDVWADDRRAFVVSGDGGTLYRMLTGQGRLGQRFGTRMWERDARFAAQHQLLLIAGKKWHQGKRLTAAIRAHTAIPALDYVFNEVEAGLPDLGGLASSVEKRERHRRTLLRLLFDALDSDTLVLCVDPHALGLIADLTADSSRARLLILEGPLDDAFLTGHLERVGLLRSDAGAGAARRMLSAMRTELRQETERLRELPLADKFVLDPRAPRPAQQAAMAGFLSVDAQTAQRILDVPNLLDD